MVVRHRYSEQPQTVQLIAVAGTAEGSPVQPSVQSTGTGEVWVFLSELVS